MITKVYNAEVYYTTKLYDGEVVTFKIPVADMETVPFTETMEAKLLGRWIYEEE